MRASAYRNHPTWWAFAIHRVSGVALAAFLPAHFWVLGRALESEAALDGMLAWTAHPLLKLVETGLVVLLAAHLAGGLRVMAIEFLAWNARQKNAVAVSAFFALATGLLFLLNAVA
jgi:fumarate reductase subunit D